MKNILIATLGLVLVSCSGTDDNNSNNTNNGTTEALSPELHECTPYESTEFANTFTGNYVDAASEGMETITVPDDIGGGYVNIELTVPADTLAAGLEVRADGDTSGAILASTSSGEDAPHIWRGGFSVAPGQTYNLRVQQGLAADPDQYPVAYELSYEFTSLVDCYEDNDTPETAKQVPVGTMIEAYAVAGYRDNGLTAGPYVDWYKIVVNRSATVEAELVTPPGDHRTRIRFFAPDGTTQLQSGGGNAGGETFTVTQDMEAGTYLMAFEVADAEPAAWDHDRAQPAFWSAPYTIDLREAQ